MIRQNPGVEEAILRLAREGAKPLAQVQREFEGALRELVAVQRTWATRVLDAIFRPTHARAYTVRAEASELDRLRELDRQHTLVFLPSHRSYVDPMVLARLFKQEGLARSYIFGGINMSFWPLGAIGRRAGVVFIRRTFREDEAYRA